MIALPAQPASNTAAAAALKKLRIDGNDASFTQFIRDDVFVGEVELAVDFIIGQARRFAADRLERGELRHGALAMDAKEAAHAVAAVAALVDPRGSPLRRMPNRLYWALARAPTADTQEAYRRRFFRRYRTLPASGRRTDTSPKIDGRGLPQS